MKMGYYWPQNHKKCITCNTNQIIHHLISLFLKEIIIREQKLQEKAKMANIHFFTYVRIIENIENLDCTTDIKV